MPKTSKPVPREELYESIERLEDPRNRALVGTLYVLACRVGELVGQHPLRKRDIEDVGDRHVFTVFTEKNPEHPTRGIPVPKGEHFLLYLQTWLAHPVNKNLADDFPIFYSYGRWGSETYAPTHAMSCLDAWRIIKKANPNLWLHLLRHSRLTEVAPRMLPLELQAMAGWSSVEPLNNYMHLMESVYAGKIKPWKPS